MKNALRVISILSLYAILHASIPLYAGLSRELTSDEVSKLKGNIYQNPDNLKSRQFLASHYMNKKDWDNAIKYLAPKADKLGEKSLFQLATAYRNNNELRQAEVVVRILTSKKPKSMKGLILAAQVHAAQTELYTSKEFKEAKVNTAIETLKMAQSYHPEEEEVYNQWFELLEKYVPHYQFDALTVLGLMEKHLELQPKHYSLACKYNFLAEFHKQAITSCEKAIKEDKKNPQNLILLGEIHMKLGDSKKGKRVLSSVGKKYSKSEEALWRTAKMYQDLKNLPEAYKYYKKAAKHKDAKPRSYLGLAQVSFGLKKYEEALKSFEKHCKMTQVLHHEFRRASGLLKSSPRWQKRYRHIMHYCNSSKKKPTR